MEEDVSVRDVKRSGVRITDTDKAGPSFVLDRWLGRKLVRPVFQVDDGVRGAENSHGGPGPQPRSLREIKIVFWPCFYGSEARLATDGYIKMRLEAVLVPLSHCTASQPNIWAARCVH